MRVRLRQWVLGLALMALAIPVAAFQITIETGIDNTIYSLGGDLSNGQGEHFFAGQAGSRVGNPTQRALLQFDIAAALPAGATIDAVSIILTPTTPRPRLAGTLAAHRATREWGESNSIGFMGEGGGGTAVAGDATWTSALFGTQLWTTPGGDFDATASAQASALGMEVVLTSATLVADVQQALDDPTNHFGWLLKLTDETQPSFRFASFQSLGSRPQLVVDYTVVPEPTSAALLGLGLVLLSARRGGRR